MLSGDVVGLSVEFVAMYIWLHVYIQVSLLHWHDSWTVSLNVIGSQLIISKLQKVRLLSSQQLKSIVQLIVGGNIDVLPIVTKTMATTTTSSSFISILLVIRS